MLDIQGVSKYFGTQRVLENLNLKLTAGRITALLARNGAGKSTLVSLIAGRLRPDAGTIYLNGRRLNHGGSRSRDRDLIRHIGVAPQDTGVYPDLSALENLVFAGGCYGLRGSRLKAAAHASLERLGLAAIAEKKARELSGGQKRRLHTGMALVHEPSLVLLDEPTVGSDPEARRYILDLVRALAAGGAAVLYTSHYFPEIETLRADLAFLNAGRITTQGSFADVVGGAVDGNTLEDRFFAATRS
ncbi:MAG: ABC transporter ATP-binding protein, partial [Leptospirales bacterium]